MKTAQLPATPPKTLLVIQFRDDITLGHEQDLHKQFVASQGANIAIKFVSFYDDAVALVDLASLLHNVDGVILGGSAGLCIAAHATDASRAIVHRICQLLDPIITACAQRGIPMLGICFGHQLLALHFGGNVEFDKQRAETGILDITPLPAAADDALLSAVTHPFKAILGHQDSVTALPPTAVTLARSSLCETQAVRYAPTVWGVQFHPDLSYDGLIERLRLFPQYLEYAATIEVAETSEATQVLARFLQLVSAE